MVWEKETTFLWSLWSLLPLLLLLLLLLLLQLLLLLLPLKLLPPLLLRLRRRCRSGLLCPGLPLTIFRLLFRFALFLLLCFQLRPNLLVSLLEPDLGLLRLTLRRRG